MFCKKICVIYIYIYMQNTCLLNISKNKIYIYIWFIDMMDIYICGEHMLANLRIAMLYIHTVLRTYIRYCVWSMRCRLGRASCRPCKPKKNSEQGRGHRQSPRRDNSKGNAINVFATNRVY